MKKIVVIGASAASISFITKVRSIDKESAIVCITKERHMPYNRCFLADVLQGEKSKSDIMLKPASWYTDNAVDVRVGKTVIAIDRSKKVLELADDTQESYDILFFGIGARAAMPPIKGLDTLGVFPFYTLADIEAIENFYKQKPGLHVTVIGGGINGIEAASALCELGYNVRIIELQERLMPLQLTGSHARFVKRRAEEKNVETLCGFAVERIVSKEGYVSGVVVDGVQLATDMVVIATGARQNSELIASLDLEMDKHSLVVNSCMQTSDQSIYAGGDIVATQHMVTKKQEQSAAWADAMLQGLCAGSQLTPRPRMYPGIINARDSWFFGFDYYACGDTTSQSWDTAYHARVTTGFETLYVKNNVLCGFVIYGDLERMSLYKRWYMKQETIALENIDMVFDQE